MTNAPVATPPLLYKNPVPLDSNKHRDSVLRSGQTLSFTGSLHAVPVNIVEFPQLSHYYPIVFSPDESATPVCVLGLSEGENLFVDIKTGRWVDESAYIPAYIRRYPFIFAEITGTDQLTLCIDDDPSVLDTKGDLHLFDDKGSATPLTTQALEFCKSFHAATLQTRDFARELAKSGLLVDREAEIPLPGKRAVRFAGFRVLDESKWAEVDPALLLDWKKRGWLAAVYAHLFAGQQWARLARLYAERHAPPSQDAA